MTEVASATERLHAAFRTDAGLVRKNNEDLPLIDVARGLFGVIDGVGGSNAGEVAAAIARDVILNRLARPLGTPRERVREAIALANNEIFKRAQRARELRGMTCVITLAIVSGDSLTIGHVGDSRLYLLGPQGLRKLTHDHSPIGEREDARELNELEAMRHPRRNEVYRDVGSALHDKDELDFVEVVEAAFTPESALLLCTDGLTDLVPSGTIDAVVRRYAGDPQRVADALVDAANDAGGFDNVTVVYVEGAAFGFWRAPGAGAVGPTPPGITAANARPGEAPVADSPSAPHSRGLTWGRRAWRALGAFARWVVQSRTTWFAAGTLAGVLGALGLASIVDRPAASEARTLIAGSSAPFHQLQAALDAAKPGDLVRVEPGVYAERIVIPDGVDLVARVPGTVTLRRASGTVGPWVAVTAAGTRGGRVAGLRIESTADAAVDVAIRLAGQGRTIETCDVVGPTNAAVELQASSTAVVQGSVFEVPAVALRLDEGAQARLYNNVFSHVGRGRAVPIAAAASAQLSMSRNVFAGFGPVLAEGAGGPRQLDPSGNFLLAPETKGAR
jgi:serine/threonine protein phosphatase PrpC